MPFHFPFWWTTASTSIFTPISTLAPTLTEKIRAATDTPSYTFPHNTYRYTAHDTLVEKLGTLLVYVVSIIAIWHFWEWPGAFHDAVESVETDVDVKEEVHIPISEGTWLAPWRTKNWDVFYGLLWLAHEHAWDYSHTPFRSRFAASIREQWYEYDASQRENCLSRLLEKGVIPLFLQRGGVGITQQRSWRWGLVFPYIQLPLYTRAKNRACFEFVVPYPLRDSTRMFLQALVDNEEDYGVTICFSKPQPSGLIAYVEKNPPWMEEYSLPMNLGARAPFEVMLPLLRDEVLEESLGKRARQLRLFVEGANEEKIVPLLYWARSAVVRVEAEDYAPCDLEQWVWGVARECMPQTPWPRGVVVEAAKRELRGFGLPVQGV